MGQNELLLKYQDGEHWKNRSTEPAQRFINFLSRFGFGDILVDAGCGSGRDVNFFSSFSRLSVIGIDKDPREIERAKAQFPKRYFQVQDIEKMTIPQNSVGAFFMINVIHYLDQEAALKEIFRILCPKGYLFIHFNLRITDAEGRVDYRHNRSDILNLVSGFKIVEECVFERNDEIPFKHHHEVLELILQKP